MTVKAGCQPAVDQARAHPDTKSIPFVMLTSSTEDYHLAESYRFDVNSYIVKPVDFDEFSEAIRHLGIYWLKMNRSYSGGEHARPA